MLETLDRTKPVAFFDVDGVLVRPYVIRHFPKYLAQQSTPLFKIDKLHLMDDEFENYKRGAISYEEFATEWVSTYAAGIAGNSVREIAVQAERFWTEKSDILLYPYSVGLINLLKPDYTIVAVSGSTTDSLRPILELLGIDYLFASEIKVDENDRYIEVEPVNRATDKGKEEVVQLLKEILDGNLWGQSFGFGDNIIHDEPLLKYVGAPYLFADVSSEENQQKLIKQFAELRLKIPRVELLRQPDDDSNVIGLISKRLAALRSSN